VPLAAELAEEKAANPRPKRKSLRIVEMARERKVIDVSLMLN